MERKLQIVREITSSQSGTTLRREIVTEFTDDASDRNSYKSTSKFIHNGEIQEDPNYNGLSDKIYGIIEDVVSALDSIYEYEFNHGRVLIRSEAAEIDETKATLLPRDYFDALRELNALLEEFEEHFRGINDPSRISSDLLYVKAASQSLSAFISSYSPEDEIEIPSELPLSLLHRIRKIKLPQAESMAGVIQKIADAISKIFLN